MSLRLRLVLGMALVALVLVLTSVTITRTTRAYLQGQVDDQLDETSFPGREAAMGPLGQGGPPVRQRGYSELYLAFVDASGTIRTFVTPNLTENSLPLPALSADQIRLGDGVDERFLTVSAEDGQFRYRVLVRAFRDGSGRATIVALPMADVDAALDRLIRVEILATVAVLSLLALVTFWVLRLGVRPIKAMTATATAIAAGDLSHRVPDVRPGTEAGELGEALNVMLGRIEEAFDERSRSEQRLRRFAADASHELRTPVTTIRGYAELYRSGGLPDDAAVTEAMRRTEQEAIRMGRLIEELLLLARLDQGRTLERLPVDLAALARDAVADARAVQPERPISALVEGPVVVIGDEGRLRQVVANLMSNALLHTDPGVAVQVSAQLRGPTAVLEVRDWGPGMAQDVAAQAFERFYRADPSRVRTRGGTGLGLSITESITESLGGRVVLDTHPGEGTAVRIELPAAP